VNHLRVSTPRIVYDSICDTRLVFALWHRKRLGPRLATGGFVCIAFANRLLRIVCVYIVLCLKLQLFIVTCQYCQRKPCKERHSRSSIVQCLDSFVRCFRCHFDECQITEFHFADGQFAECHVAYSCHFAKCHFAEYQFKSQNFVISPIVK